MSNVSASKKKHAPEQGTVVQAEARAALLRRFEQPLIQKYRPYLSTFQVSLDDRAWPNRQVSRAPIWCSVDLRDGNQALINPMSLAQKLEMFRLLVEIGFKEIEIGFPSASEVEYEFARTLIEQNLIPDDVAVQVLTQSRAHLIERTFQAVAGAKRAIVHLYNSTSELQRRVVFRLDKSAIKEIAVQGTKQVKELASKAQGEIIFEYSPESFTGTELEYALEVSNAVIEVWQPTPSCKMILNLPATVEMATPNIYADQIEWMSRHLSHREAVVLSLHTHNDRGTGVAASELGLLAGADRVEGTLFGNGERTGNVDLVTMALNLFSQGIDPGLRLSDINRIREVAERCTQLPVHQRHPYAGELVFTAFSGSHQDAINKGLRMLGENGGTLWDVPYLPIDPQDIGRTYEAIIRINSQSGKGGVAYLMSTEFGCEMPKEMHPEFSAVVQRLSEEMGSEVPPQAIWKAFSKEYLDATAPYHFLNFRLAPSLTNPDLVDATLAVEIRGQACEIVGRGNGPIDACKEALVAAGCPQFQLTHFMQHARSGGSDAEAVSYIQVQMPMTAGAVPVKRFGVGIHANTEKASIKALLSAVNRAMIGRGEN